MHIQKDVGKIANKKDYTKIMIGCSLLELKPTSLRECMSRIMQDYNFPGCDIDCPDIQEHRITVMRALSIKNNKNAQTDFITPPSGGKQDEFEGLTRIRRTKKGQKGHLFVSLRKDGNIYVSVMLSNQAFGIGLNAIRVAIYTDGKRTVIRKAADGDFSSRRGDQYKGYVFNSASLMKYLKPGRYMARAIGEGIEFFTKDCCQRMEKGCANTASTALGRKKN